MPTLKNNFTKEQSKQVKGTTKSRFDDGGGDISLGSDFLDRRLEAYINATVLRPWRTLCCCYGIIIIVIFLGIFASGLIMSPSGYYEWYVKESDAAQHADMLESARVNDLIMNITERSKVSFTQLMLYKSEDGNNIFTPPNLAAMCEFEKTFVNFAMKAKKSQATKPENWVNNNSPDTLGFDHYCLLKNGKCATPDTSEAWSASSSVVYHFYGDALVDGDGKWNCSLLDVADVNSKSEALVSAMSSETGQLELGFYMGKKTQRKGYTSITRSAISVAGPLCLSKNGVAGAGECFDFASGDLDMFSDQANEYIYNLLGPWLYDVVRSVYDLKDKHPWHPFTFDRLLGSKTTPDAKIQAYTFSLLLQAWESLRLLAADQLVTFVSLLFVFMWLFIHIRSLFLATVGISQIFLSIPASIFPYAFVLQVKYFGLMQWLTIFIVLGVGADDIFVLVDAWKQSTIFVPDQGTYFDNLKMRLKYSMCRCAKAVFNTSFTTAAAFFATAVSPIMPIATFGIFSAVVIMINYIFVLTLTPAALIINEKYRNSCCCCRHGCACKKDIEEEKENSSSSNSSSVGAVVPFEKDPQNASASESDIDNTDGFLRTLLPVYLKIVTTKSVAVVMVTVLSTFLVLSCIWASLLEPPLKTEKWLPERHMLEKAFDLNRKFISLSNSQYADLHTVWGMKSLDESDYNQWDPSCYCTKANGCFGYEYSPPDCRGRVRYDKDFDLFNADTQRVIKDACVSLASWPCKEDECEYGLLIRPNTTICFVEDFDRWVAAEKGVSTTTLIDSGARAEYMTYLLEFRQNQFPLGDPSKSYDSVIGFTKNRDPLDGPSYVQVKGSMTMPLLTPLAKKGGIEKQAKKYLQNIEKIQSAKHVFQWTFDWVWSVTQQGTIDGLTTGMSLAFPIAFIALIMATNNIIIAVFAIISVGGIVAAVLGMCWHVGWVLGTGEAIAGVMVIGLSVDYTIHLGHMYVHAGTEMGYQQRSDRVKYSVETMAGTILGGAITTCGAGSFMFLCVQTFFYKMATLIVFTVLFSLLFSLFWFMPLLALIGPEGTTGEVFTEERIAYVRKLLKLENDGKHSHGEAAENEASLDENDGGQELTL